MISEVIDLLDDEYLDDPITLIDYEQARINAISHTAGGPSSDANQPNASKLMSHSQDIDSTYGKSHFVLPVTFFDISSNLKFLNECRPVAIKVVDCDKYPWYYCKFKINNAVNPMDGQETNQQESEGPLISTFDKDMNKITGMPVDLKVPEQKEETNKKKKSSFYLGKNIPHLKCRQDMEKELALNNKNISNIDYKRNVGLVGLKIAPLIDFDEKINSNNKTCKQNNTSKSCKANEVNSYMSNVDKALNDVGTIIVPIKDKNYKKIKKIRQPDPNRVSKNKAKKIKKKERKERRKEKIAKELNKISGLAGQLVTTSLKNNSRPYSTEHTTQYSNVKDKTKTNKYYNDLMKKKMKMLSVQLHSDVANVIKNTNENASPNETNDTNDTNKDSEQTIEKCDLTIDSGIKSPVLPCNKPTLKCESGQFNHNKVTTQYVVNTANKINSDEIPNISTIQTITDLNNVNKDFDKKAPISKLETKDNSISSTAQAKLNNSLNDIVISNVISVPNGVTVKVRDNINAAPKQYVMYKATDNNIPISTVSTHKPPLQNQNNIKSKSIKCLEGGFEIPHKLPSANNNSNINTSSRKVASNNGESKSVNYVEQKLSPVRNNYHSYLPIQTSSHMGRLQDQLPNDQKEKSKILDLTANSVHCYNSISPAYHSNLISNNYIPDRNKGNLHQNMNAISQPLITTNSENMYWPYWPPPFPPPLPPPPPPPPPQYSKVEQQNNKKQPSKLEITKVEVINSKNRNNNGDKSYTPPLNAAVTINIQNYNNTSATCLSKVPVQTTAQPIKRKTKEELEKELMTILKDISKKERAPNRPHVSEDRAFSEVPCTSNGTPNFYTPSVKQVTLNIDDKVSSQIKSSTQAKFDAKSLSHEGNKAIPHLYSPQENKFIKGHVYPKNKVPFQKDCFGYLLGKKVSHQPQISPAEPKVGPLSTVIENSAISTRQTESKVPNEKLRVTSGYSPPILPIPTYENSLDILYLSNSGSGQMEPVSRSKGNLRGSGTSNLIYDNTSQKRKKNQDNCDVMKLKKISLEQYKERSKSNIPFAGTTDTLPYKRLKCSRKNDSVSKSVKTLSDIVNPHSEQDLGYDSDSTVKL